MKKGIQYDKVQIKINFLLLEKYENNTTERDITFRLFYWNFKVEVSYL